MGIIKIPRRARTFILIFFFLFLPCSVASLSGTATSVPVGTPLSHHNSPSVSGDRVVWVDDRTGRDEIYVYNFSSGEEWNVTDGSVVVSNPEISGNLIVWQDDLFSADGKGTDIVAYFIDNDTTFRITNYTGNQEYPDTDGSLVVWQDDRNFMISGYDIYLYNVTENSESCLTDAEGEQSHPKVSGSKIVWEDAFPIDRNIFLYDLGGNRTPFQVIPDSLGTEQNQPAIDRDQLVWVDTTPDWIPRIFKENLTAYEILALTPDDNSYSAPDIDGNVVAWVKNDIDVYVEDISIPGSATRITSSDTIKDHVRVAGNRIVWHESVPGDAVYLFTLGSQETCPEANFSFSPMSGSMPLTVAFSYQSVPGTVPVTRWSWEFGDGNKSDLQNPVYTYLGSGTFPVRLEISNPVCRDMTLFSSEFNVSVGSRPIASFDTSSDSGLVPFTVQFNDTSLSSTAWNWSFGDYSYSDVPNPSHEFLQGGDFEVLLNASNSYGFSLASKKIHALTGANESAHTRIEGLSVENRSSGQFLVFNGSAVPGYLLPAANMLIVPTVPDRGWQNVTFVSSDLFGFLDLGNATIVGNLTEVIFHTNDIHPAGFNPAIGDNIILNYSVRTGSYPDYGTLSTRIWSEAQSGDLDDFQQIAQKSSWARLLGVAYTVKISEYNFSTATSAKFHLSVNSSWIDPSLGHDHVYFIRIAENRTGEVLATRYLSSDPVKNLDYFEAFSPNGLSTFGLAQLSGTGNIGQLITLAAAGSSDNSHQPSGLDSSNSAGSQTSSGSGASGVQAKTDTGMRSPSADPGNTGRISTDNDGVVTEAGFVVSHDGLVTLSLPTGTIARDNSGFPLSSVTLRSLLPETLPAVPDGLLLSFAGLAYDISPDGATFSPAIPVTFTLPETREGLAFTVKSFDPGSGTWIDLPSSYDPDTGTITATVSHLCCFAVFSETAASQPPTPAIRENTPPEQKSPPAQPPTTAISIFISMISFVAGSIVKNAYLFLAAIILVAVFLGFRRRKKPSFVW